MSPMNLKWKIWGRPIKPVAFALSLTMLVLFGFNATNNGILDGSPEGDILGGFALGVSVLFTFGWFRGSQAATELALIGALFAWTARFWLTVFLVPSPWISAPSCRTRRASPFGFRCTNGLAGVGGDTLSRALLRALFSFARRRH